MPRRELLTPIERAQLFAFPEDEGELIRLATLSRADLTYIRQHRGDHNRLGLAVQMAYLRHPSRVIAAREAPHPPLLGIVAALVLGWWWWWQSGAKKVRGPPLRVELEGGRVLEELREDDLREAAMTIAEAFGDGPWFVHMLPGTRAQRVEGLAWLMERNLWAVQRKEPSAVLGVRGRAGPRRSKGR